MSAVEERSGVSQPANLVAYQGDILLGAATRECVFGSRQPGYIRIATKPLGLLAPPPDCWSNRLRNNDPARIVRSTLRDAIGVASTSMTETQKMVLSRIVQALTGCSCSLGIKPGDGHRHEDTNRILAAIGLNVLSNAALSASPLPSHGRVHPSLGASRCARSASPAAGR